MASQSESNWSSDLARYCLAWFQGCRRDRFCVLIYDYEEQHQPIAQLTQEERTIALDEEAGDEARSDFSVRRIIGCLDVRSMNYPDRPSN